jgi:hypothetical protein
MADKGGGFGMGEGDYQIIIRKASPWTKVINVLGESQAPNTSKNSFSDFEKE